MEQRPLRVLALIHRLSDNSPYCFYVHEQAKALCAAGHDVRVISPVGVAPMMRLLQPDRARIASATPKHAVVDGISIDYPRYVTLGNAGEQLLGGLAMARAVLPIARVLHAHSPFDILHAHMLPVEGHAGLILSRALGIPCAITVHGTDVLANFVPGHAPSRRNARIAREADALMPVSEMLCERITPYRGDGRLTRVVCNGVDLSLVPRDVPKRPRAVLSVGTLKARKCMDRTLEAFARLAGEFPDATLTLVGMGEAEDALRARISQLELGSRVHLTGALSHEQVLRLMAESDLFVLPSWGEGFGVVYIEAMAAGCIAVGAKGEGIDGTIRDGENGFLVRAGDIEQIGCVMRRVFLNRDSLSALREAGQRTARALTWARNAQQTVSVYREAIANNQAI